jgi:drug/metabolite transporter (DMT)-like permease
MMFAALRHLPLADAIAIAFVMPFLLLLLGRTVLGETVGPRRLAACAVGFAGTLLVIQPSFAAVGWAALLPLGVATCPSPARPRSARMARSSSSSRALTSRCRDRRSPRSGTRRAARSAPGWVETPSPRTR